MTSGPSRIHSEIAYELDGKQHGFLRLPYSVHRSAYGWLPIPIVQIKSGDGPTILLMSGNHGDEYEGQVTLSKLCREITTEHIKGRLIILTMANYPAARAGQRTSPLDQGNLNRSFPGDPDGTPTEMIAHYIETVLMDMADYVIDLHSGGSSLMYPATSIRMTGSTPEEEAELASLAEAYDAPYSLVFETAPEGSSMDAAERAGALSISTELGGAGTVTPDILEISERGLRRVLHEIGVLNDYEPDIQRGTTQVYTGGDSYYVYASDEGLFEPYFEMDDSVEKGSDAGAIHHPETPWVTATVERFEHSGIIICKRIPGRVQRGDCLFHLATLVE